MPHICTRCNSIFDSGDDILRGCPVCGWRKFMFVKKLGHDATQSADQLINQSMGVKRPPNPNRQTRARFVERPKSGNGQKATPVSSKPARLKIDACEARAEAPVQPKAAVERENEKLESIKITAPGTYELNLPSLFERDELIMAVKEGTYFIDLSSAFRKGNKKSEHS
jgi:predicted  nucleic acid-binding Zn-ribbon protein